MPRRTLATRDDVRLAGRRWLTPGSPEAAVVLVHGFTASADDPSLVAVGDALHAIGLDVISFDARGHGGSEGECTLGDLERHDVAAAVDLARERTDRVVLVGASMGAIAVLRHAAGHHAESDADGHPSDADGHGHHEAPPLAGVVAVSCPSRWRLPTNPVGLASALLTRTPPGRYLAHRFMGVRIAPRWADPVPPLDLVGRIDAPVALVHGRADRFIPPDSAGELYDAAGDPRRLDLVEGMGHAYEQAAVGPIGRSVQWVLGH